MVDASVGALLRFASSRDPWSSEAHSNPGAGHHDKGHLRTGQLCLSFLLFGQVLAGKPASCAPRIVDVLNELKI